MAEILELTTENHWQDAISILKELRPDLDTTVTLNSREELMSRGYKFYALLHGGKFVCVAGALIQAHITRGNDFWVHDLVTAPNARSKGYGKEMMIFLEHEAQRLGCSRLSVHTRLNRDRAQNFYENHLGYARYAVVFQK